MLSAPKKMVPINCLRHEQPKPLCSPYLMKLTIQMKQKLLMLDGTKSSDLRKDAEKREINLMK